MKGILHVERRHVVISFNIFPPSHDRTLTTTRCGTWRRGRGGGGEEYPQYIPAYFLSKYLEYLIKRKNWQKNIKEILQ
jgi:hypothetical protein